MLAHRIKVVVPVNHEVKVTLPSNFPPGEAELIVLSDVSSAPSHTTKANAPAGSSTSVLRRFPKAGTFGPIELRDDPVAPLDADDWSEDLSG
jgi:hypothetical protein